MSFSKVWKLLKQVYLRVWFYLWIEIQFSSEKWLGIFCLKKWFSDINDIFNDIWIKYLATGIEEYKIPHRLRVELDWVTDASCPLCLTNGRGGRLISFICKFCWTCIWRHYFLFFSVNWCDVCIHVANKCRKHHKKTTNFVPLVILI